MATRGDARKRFRRAHAPAVEVSGHLAAVGEYVPAQFLSGASEHVSRSAAVADPVAIEPVSRDRAVSKEVANAFVTSFEDEPEPVVGDRLVVAQAVVETNPVVGQVVAIVAIDSEPPDGTQVGMVLEEIVNDTGGNEFVGFPTAGTGCTPAAVFGLAASAPGAGHVLR